MYLRYCFVNRYFNFKGHEIIIELGSGASLQIELLKKLYPDLTILLFDLPAQLFLSNIFLKNSLGDKHIVSIEKTMEWVDLTKIEKGKVHYFGNWQFPILNDFQFDLFWNAASFGEMEPEIVKNYMKYVLGNAEMVFLLNARNGKEITGANIVKQQITFNDYKNLLPNYQLIEEEDAFYAYKKMNMSGGYFQGIWKKIV